YNIVMSGAGRRAQAGLRADQTQPAESKSTMEAAIEGTKKLPDHCANRPATSGPTRRPTPNDAVISATARRAARGASIRPACNPSAVAAIKVKPSRTPPGNGPI